MKKIKAYIEDINEYLETLKDKKLERSDNHWLGGVIGGLAEFFDIKADLLRVILILLFCMPLGGFLGVAYFILWILMPEK